MYVILYTEHDCFTAVLLVLISKSFSKHRPAITDAQVQYECTRWQKRQHTELCVQPSASHKAKVII